MKPRIVIALAVVLALVGLGVGYARSASKPPVTTQEQPIATETASIVASSAAATAGATTPPAATLSDSREKAAAAAESKRVALDASDDNSSDSPSTKDEDDDADSKPGSDDEQPGEELRFGLTLEQRKACYWEWVAAEDRAISEASAKYPLVEDDITDQDKHFVFRMSLEARYQAEIREKYSLTAHQMRLLMSEGQQALWPMPPLE
ncbi:MAG TPA: hypothetical protein VLA05_08685 [Coriobacteriia bacterium]|nr:hypothetical protein [Coriobacteriia bacterium]